MTTPIKFFRCPTCKTLVISNNQKSNCIRYHLHDLLEITREEYDKAFEEITKEIKTTPVPPEEGSIKDMAFKALTFLYLEVAGIIADDVNHRVKALVVQLERQRDEAVMERDERRAAMADIVRNLGKGCSGLPNDAIAVEVKHLVDNYKLCQETLGKYVADASIKQESPDPNTEQKAAFARGEMIEFKSNLDGSWLKTPVPEWNKNVEYRIVEPKPKYREAHRSADKQDSFQRAFIYKAGA